MADTILSLVAEIDFLYYQIEDLAKRLKQPRSGLDIAIDRATNRAAGDLRDAKRIARQIKTRKLKLGKLRGETIPTEFEDAILALE